MLFRSISLVLLSTVAAAQTQVEWTNAITASGAPAYPVACFDVPGLTIFAGNSGQGSPVSGYVRAVDANGLETWTAHPATGARSLVANSVAYDGVGRIAVSGVLMSPAQPGEDAALFVYDLQGNEIWTATWAEPGGEPWLSCFVAGFVAGGPVLSGGFRSGSKPSADPANVGAISFDASGNVRWRQALIAPNDQKPGAARLDSGGDLYVVGMTLDYTDLGIEGFAAKVTASGSIAWFRDSSDVFTSLAIDAQDRPYLGGTRQTGEDTFAALITGVDSATGAERFAIELPGNALTGTRAMAAGPGGVVVATGGVSFFNELTAFTLAIDAQGNELWRAFHAVLGSTPYVAGNAVSIDSAGDVVVTGDVTGNFPSNYTPFTIRYPRSIAPLASWISTEMPAPPLVPTVASVVPVRVALDETGGVRVLGRISNGVESGGCAWRIAPDARTLCVGDSSAGPCPCGNASTSFERAGCSNSLGFGGKLEWSGTPSIAADTLRLHASSMPATTTALYLQGTGSSVAATPFGDGISCLGAPIARLRTIGAVQGRTVDPSASAPTPISIQGSVTTAGSVRTYQVRYRNSAAFCTSAGWNTTNAIEVTWRP